MIDEPGAAALRATTLIAMTPAAASVLVIGIGSGKTTLAENLRAILQPAAGQASPVTSTCVLHQDDFCPPKDQMPFNEKWQSDYARLAAVISYARTHGRLPPDFESSEHRRSNYRCSLSDEELQARRNKFHAALAARSPVPAPVMVLVVEGFLMFYSAEVRRLLDVRLFLRVPRAEMLRRRLARANYVLEDGEVWEDPPSYFDEIVWPAYLDAHAGMFEKGDVENGALISTTEDSADGGPVRSLAMIEADQLSKTEVTDTAMEVLLASWT